MYYGARLAFFLMGGLRVISARGSVDDVLNGTSLCLICVAFDLEVGIVFVKGGFRLPFCVTPCLLTAKFGKIDKIRYGRRNVEWIMKMIFGVCAWTS